LQLPAAGLNLGGEVDFASRYIWLGMPSSQGPVMQPSLWLTLDNTSLTLWSNMNLANEPQRGEFNETDLTLSSEIDWNGWRVEPSFEYWTDRRIRGIPDPATGQAGVELSHGIGPLRVFTNETCDVVAFPGAYYGDAGLSFEKQHKQLSIFTAARVAWANSQFNRAYAGVAANAVTYSGVEVAATFHPRTGRLYLRPHVEASRIVDRTLRAYVKPNNLFDAGLAIGFQF
jgi:hypothetical protein